MPTKLSETRVTRAKIGSVEVDVTRSEEHSGEVEVTQHPVEQGADPTDHAREKPETLRLECFVSNTPIAKADRDALGEMPKGTGRAKTFYDQLRVMKAARKLVSVSTAIRAYDNMMITGLSVPRDSHTGDGLAFSISFMQVRVVKNLTIQVPTKDLRAKGLSKLGKQNGPAAEPAQVNKSALKKGADTENGDAFLKFIGWR